jgi:simple sugar transport system permease protein
MLIGAFFAIYTVDRAGSTVLGLLGGVLAGAVLGLIYGVAVLRYKADEIVAGIAINLMALGTTTFLLKTAFGASGVYRPMDMVTLPPLVIPLVKDIPILGEALSGHNPLVYASFLIVIITYVLLFKTPFGLGVRSTGEEPEAARTAGINPQRIKMLTILWSGALCGLAGAHLSTGYVSEFSENMTQGRGFTAFTAIIFGNNHPVWTFLACLVFAVADALGIRVQLEGFGLPPSILKMFPYVLAIVVLTISSAVRKRQYALAGDVYS